jgi:steroid 5-alpha reductase family enzyme
VFELNAWLSALPPIGALAAATWGVSVAKRDVSIVDSVWSLFFLAAAVSYAFTTTSTGVRAVLVLTLVTLWALRLSLYISWRNWGEGEDHRYRAIRARNQPGFALKSLYLVFGLQGLLAWIISLPLLAAIAAPGALNLLDYPGAALMLFGLAFETIADRQLAEFKARPENRGRVLDRGLWRYTRHPNYFGEFCVWWGFYLIALAAGGWWTAISPLLMSFLLLKVSGVVLLERDIGRRRPAYREYVERTNAFFPGWPRSRANAKEHA